VADACIDTPTTTNHEHALAGNEAGGEKGRREEAGKGMGGGQLAGKEREIEMDVEKWNLMRGDRWYSMLHSATQCFTQQSVSTQNNSETGIKPGNGEERRRTLGTISRDGSRRRGEKVKR